MRTDHRRVVRMALWIQQVHELFFRVSVRPVLRRLTAFVADDVLLVRELLLVDAENNTTREITVTPSLLTAYRAEFLKYCEAVEAYCGKYQLGYVRTTTDFPFEELVLKVFRQGRFLK